MKDSDWIMCKDRLPEQGLMCYVTIQETKNGNNFFWVEILAFDDGVTGWDDKDDPSFYDCEYPEEQYYNLFGSTKAIAWMPYELPEPCRINGGK